MDKRFSLLFLLLFCVLLPFKSFSAEQVLVLPFAINAPVEQQRLEWEIPNIIRKQLKAEGALVTPVDPSLSLSDIGDNLEKIRDMAILEGADFVIWGSFTRLGNAFSLDTAMLQTFGNKPVQTFFVEGEGIEQLPTALNKLITDISILMFKKKKVVKVLVEGNQRIESDAIMRRIKTMPGEIFLTKSLSQDLKSVYQMGYFEDVQVESEDHADGKIIIFSVKEKPTIRVIKFDGNSLYDTEELKKTLDVGTGSILNIYNIATNIKRIETIYKEKNYHNVKIDYEVKDLKNNQADLKFIIDEGEKTLIRSITFEGNAFYDDDELKDLMKTSEKGFLSWITSAGDLKKEDLNQDISQLAAFYQNNGFIQAKVSDPVIEFTDNWIDITIKIEEGPRYKVGNVTISAPSEADLIPSREALMEKISMVPEAYYNRETIRNDILELTDHYSNEGYAYANVAPIINEDPENLVVDITYNIDKEQLVYFEKIFITGNTKTRDKVIRRELNVYEQELYSGKRLKEGVRNLYRLDYFEDIKVDTLKGSTDDTMVLKVDVKEKPTGAFSFGGGYNVSDNLFVMATISQKNLFGRGQILELKGSLSSVTSRFTLSFTEPWLFDTRVSFGFDLFNWEYDYDEYTKKSVGGRIRFGYKLFDFTRLFLSYRYENNDVFDVSPFAAESIQDLEGITVESSIATTLRYDSRDNFFNPTGGANHRLMFEFAGIGGDIAFLKYEGELGFYIPLFWKTTGFIHGKGGHVKELSGGILPDYEKYYLGGINSVRGFEWRSISAFDNEGNPIGGNSMVQFNLEYIVPLLEKTGLVGVVFFDAGNVYGSDETIDLKDLRTSAGGGIRWYSPMGPIRLEYGYILDREPGEKKGSWEFSMGAAF
jgi:outer membrane protein insertion porin family